ncbi:MAG: DUF2970 domain-containing protein [Pseudomonadota bacterium]
MNQQPSNPDPDQKEKSIPVLQVVLSVLQASFGVQNSRNRERDFTQGKFGVFVVAALIFTALFVLTIVGIVSLVLPD